jgi:hypothetical protein
MHCTENLKQIFPDMKLRDLVPNFHIHVSVSDLHIPTIGPQTQNSKIGGPIVEKLYINHLQIHESRIWKRGSAVSFLGIFVSNFRYSEWESIGKLWVRTPAMHGQGELFYITVNRLLFNKLASTAWSKRRWQFSVLFDLKKKLSQ